MLEVKINGLDELAAGMEKIVKGYPAEVRKFLRAEGQKAKRRAEKNIKQQTHKASYMENYMKHSRGQRQNRQPHEGLEKAVAVQSPYKYFVYNADGSGADSVKAYAAKSKGKKGYHAHLVEYGHEAVLWGTRTAKIVRRFYLFEKARKEMKPVFEADCEVFVNKLVGML